MKKYELMYILMPTLSDEELEKENEKRRWGMVYLKRNFNPFLVSQETNLMR